MLPREGAPGWLPPVQRAAFATALAALLLGGIALTDWIAFDARPFIARLATGLFCLSVTLFSWGTLLEAMLPPVGAPRPLAPGRELLASAAGGLASLVPSGAYIAVVWLTRGGRIAALGLTTGLVVFDLVLGVALVLPRLASAGRGRMLLIGSVLALAAPGLGVAAMAGFGAIVVSGVGGVPDIPRSMLAVLGENASVLVVGVPIVAGLRAALWLRAFDDIEPRGPVKGSAVTAFGYVVIGMLLTCMLFPVPLIAEPYAYAWVRAWLLERARRREGDRDAPA